MIVGSLSTWKDHSKFEHSVIVEAVEELKKIVNDHLDVGKIEIRGSEMYATIMELDAKSLEEQVAEKHESYIDIHYLMDGEETIGWSPLHEGLVPTKPYDHEGEYALYAPQADEILLPLKPGMFAIFFPHDIHRPNMGKGRIKKIVIKIHVGLYGE